MNEVKNEIPSIANLDTTFALNTKINEVKNKIPNITNLTTTTALTAVENKICNYSKYITTPQVNSRKFCSKISTSKFSKQNWYC